MKISMKIAATGLAAAALLSGAAAPALAHERGVNTVQSTDDVRTLAANKSIGDTHGSMTFIDDGDVFQICDTKADGHGVTGRLIARSYWTGDIDVLFTINDGGDAGCDKKPYNIGNGADYQMEYWWEGGNGFQESEWFNE